VKILICGDTHGNNAWWARLVEYAQKHACEKIVQLGDFGYWEHRREGVEYLDKTSKKATMAGIPIYFIDGNHENHPLLWERYPPGEDGFCKLRENLYYIPRGNSWTWDGVKFLGIGGAYSVDKPWRVQEEETYREPRTLWWPTELIRDVDVQKCLEVGKVDVVFSHDCPTGIELPGIGGEYPVSNANRAYLRHIIDHVQPQVVFHGHYHMRNSGQLNAAFEQHGKLLWRSVRVEGYAHDGEWSQNSWQVIETKEISSA